MPLPEFRLLPFPQLSLLTLPVAVTVPGGLTGLGDLRLANIAVLDTGPRVPLGSGSDPRISDGEHARNRSGQMASGTGGRDRDHPGDWLVGVLARTRSPLPATDRPAVYACISPRGLSVGRGWFIRSQPQMVFNWKSGG